MRVVIAGLLSKQHALVGTYRRLDVRFASHEGKHGTGSEQLFKHADRILLMRNFISHGLTDKLDRARSEGKTVLVRGGLTALKHQLETLDSIALEPTPEQEEPDVAKPNFNFKPLQRAVEGDELVFHKPADMPAIQFALAMSGGRSYVKQKFGVRTEQVISGGGNKCTIKVLRQPETEQAAPAPVVEAARAPRRESEGRIAQFFWRQVFLQSLNLRPSAETIVHIACADAAADAWTAKFGETL